MIRLLQDILAQPGTLSQVLDYHSSRGRSALLQAARVAANAPRLVLTGMGSSLFACHPLSQSLAARGIASMVVDNAELLHYAHPICRDATVVLVSRSGESVEAVKLLPLLKAQGATVIGVTNEPDSTLAREAQHILLIASRADEAVAVQTYTATLASLHLLGAAMAGELDAGQRELQAVIGVVEPWLDGMAAASESWRPFFEGAACLYLLARGASLASSTEGALLFHEVSKLPAISMGAGIFRHGPVEAVEPQFRALVFAPNDSTRALNLALARDLAALGGHTVSIGPAADWQTPDVPAALAPIVEIMPVQLAALRLAGWRGIPPGKFRHTAQVTRTEEGFQL